MRVAGVAAVIGWAVALLAGCAGHYEPRELPEWVAGFRPAEDHGYRIIPLRSFLIEEYPTGETDDDDGGALIYAIVNPEGVGSLDIDIDTVTLLAGAGGSFNPEAHVTLYRSEHVVIGGLSFPPLPSKAERLDLGVRRLRGDDGSAVEGRWLVEEVLMRMGNSKETRLSAAARMEFAHFTRDGGVLREGSVAIGSDVHEGVSYAINDLSRPLIWVADPEVHFVPFNLDWRTPRKGWGSSLQHVPE